MRIHLRALGHLSEYMESMTEESDLEVAPGTTIAGVLEACSIPAGEVMLILLNGKRAADTVVLNNGDVLELIPTFAGG